MKYNKIDAIEVYTGTTQKLYRQYDRFDRTWKVIDKKGNEYKKDTGHYYSCTKKEPEVKSNISYSSFSDDFSIFIALSIGITVIGLLALIICLACCA